jgi:hypothetical protein
MGMHIEYDLSEFLRELMEAGYLEGAAEGITKKVISEGEESLSPKQQFVFKRDVLDEYITPECKRMGCQIPWEEMLEAHDNGGLCSWCAKMASNDD